MYDVPEAFVDIFGYTDVLGVSVGAWLALAVLGVGWLLLHGTVFGRYVYAIGSNPTAGHSSGISIRPTSSSSTRLLAPWPAWRRSSLQAGSVRLSLWQAPALS
jgi:ABC-type glucose/galactose transport system permease subunit